MTNSLRTVGWLLIAASISFLLVIVSMVGGVVAAGPLPAEPITHVDLDPIAAWRAVLGWTLLVPIGLAGVASIRLARGTTVRWLSTTTIVVWALAIGATLAYAIAWQVSLGFTTETILDDPARKVADILFGRFAIPLAALGSAGTALCLRTVTGTRGPLIVAVLAVLLAAPYAILPHNAVPIPPAILIALWIPLGVSALRSRSRRVSSLPIPATT